MGVRADRENIVDVSGGLTFDSVPAMYLEARSLFTAGTGTVDLAAVTSVDSAGLALLLEWQADAKKRGADLAFINAPPDLLRIAALSESTGLLGLVARSDPAGENRDV
jgi:phospholipid transport system transporter-binding protein